MVTVTPVNKLHVGPATFLWRCRNPRDYDYNKLLSREWNHWL